MDGTVWDAALGGCVPNWHSCGDPVSYQGYDYATVRIAEQCWFAENLRSSLYKNGEKIPSNLDDSEWTSTTSGAMTVYGEGASDCKTSSPDDNACDPTWSLNEYGRLYNWYAVDDERGLCPSGWHVPTDREWMEMGIALGMSEVEASSGGRRGTDQGSQIKTVFGWAFDGNGSNSSGFSGLPGGERWRNGSFITSGVTGNWWSSSPIGSVAWFHFVSCFDKQINRNRDTRLQEGKSIRCIQDAE